MYMKVEKKKAVEFPRSFSNPTVFHPDRMICYCNLTFIGSIPQNNLHMHDACKNPNGIEQ